MPGWFIQHGVDVTLKPIQFNDLVLNYGLIWYNFLFPPFWSSVRMRPKYCLKIMKWSRGTTFCEIYITYWRYSFSLHWRHNGRVGVSNHRPYDCLLNRLFRRRSKNASKFRVAGLCEGNHRWPVNSPHKGPVTRKMFPFDDVIMFSSELYVD